MDAGASVAAFIGLVGLVAQSTTSLIQLTRDIRDAPGTQQSNLKWLEQLSCVLKELQNTGSDLQEAKLTIDLSTMEWYLRDCREAIDILRAHLEKSLDGLKSTGLAKRKATLKAYFSSRSAECQIQSIQRAMEGLNLCHSIIVRQIGVHSHRSIQELTAQTNDLTLGTQDIRRVEESTAADIAGLRSIIDRAIMINRQDIQQLQHANLETLQRVQNLQAGYEWMAAVQGVLPLEIHSLVRNAIAEELGSASHDQQTLSQGSSRKQTLSLNPSIQNVLPLERPGTLPTSHMLDRTSDCQSWEQFEEMEKDLLPPYRNRSDNYTAFRSSMQEQRPYIKSKTLMFSWYYRAFLGYFSVVVSERHQVTAGREENVVHIEIKIFPWRWISSQGFQARILYDRTHGLSSPTNIQLDFPRIIPIKVTDIWRLFDQRSGLIIDSIRRGSYRPNDLLEEIGPTGTGPMSLLTVASLFGDAKVVRFLLQQGARVDQSEINTDRPALNLPDKSDLQRALAPKYWPIETRFNTVSMTSAAREARLDTARLLINAGSDIDSITFTTLLRWAMSWDLETILSVVGNYENFHWDVNQLEFLSLDWFRVSARLAVRSEKDPLAYQSAFENLLKLCKRLKIDPSFTQPSGLTLLHMMIYYSRGCSFSGLKDCLSVLVSNGVDPCAVCDGYLTPTLVAFFSNKLHSWFTVLRQSGISVDAVAAHTLGLLTGSTVPDIISRVTSKPMDKFEFYVHCSALKWLNPRDNLASIFQAARQLRAALIEAFERQGCYLNESCDRGSMVTYKASSSVDFTPSTVYDPERAKQDFRRRTAAQKHPQ